MWNCHVSSERSAASLWVMFENRLYVLYTWRGRKLFSVYLSLCSCLFMNSSNHPAYVAIDILINWRSWNFAKDSDILLTEWREIAVNFVVAYTKVVFCFENGHCWLTSSVFAENKTGSSVILKSGLGTRSLWSFCWQPEKNLLLSCGELAQVWIRGKGIEPFRKS